MTAFFEAFKLLIGELGINDILDILLVAYIIYKVFIFIRDSRAQLIFKALLIIGAAYFAAWLLKLQMVSYVIDLIIKNAAVALVVIFQPELRTLLERVGRSRLKLSELFMKDDDQHKHADTVAMISNVAEAARYLQKQCMGALIVFEQKQTLLNDVIKDCKVVDALPNVYMLTSIFFKNSPLHDGAVLISNNRIIAASCILPMTNRMDIDPSFGTRHRAAIGVSENSDAVVVVVSEETGRLSVVHNGVVKSSFDPSEFSTNLMALLLPQTVESEITSEESMNSRIAAWYKKLRRLTGKKSGKKKKTGSN